MHGRSAPQTQAAGNTPHPARKPRIGLALGGGAARGLAHILVFEAFEELGLRPDLIAGTSIGALFGAAFAAGMSAAQIRAHTEETLTNRFDLLGQLFSARAEPIQKLFRIFPLRSALLDADAILDVVLPASVPETFEALQIPLQIVATDIGMRDSVVFNSGQLKPAIAASIAIPIVFAPVSRDNRTLADGGLTNPLPYDLLAGSCDIVVAIDVSGAASEASIGPNPGITTMVTQSIQILQKRIIRERLEHNRPDIYIDVDLDRFGAYQFHKVTEILTAALPAKQELKARLARVVASHPA